MSTANSFLRLNSTGSQPASPTSHRSEQKQSTTEKCCGPIFRFFRANPRLSRGLGHVALVVLLACYTAAGASVFQWLEQPHELSEAARLQSKVLETRQQLLQMWEEAHNVHEYDQVAVLVKINDYEEALSQAVANKVPLRPGEVPTQWTYTQSVFFASTVLTTIGYGNIAPATIHGRIFCIFFALIGIPFTLTVIADLGVLMATAVSVLYNRIRQRCRWANSRAVQSFGRRYGKSLSAILVVLLLIVYIAIGGGIFMIWEDWDFLESFYFCFITMTTIGFGDLVPGLSVCVPASSGARPSVHHAQTTYMLVCTIYILIGLALTTSIIELIRRQYAQSWKKMRELTFKLQGLTGPLADTLRRLSEHASKMGADGKLDPELLKELADLKMALSAVNEEMRRPSVSRLISSGNDANVEPAEDLCSEESDTWPMEWDECWEERWMAIEEMMSSKAFKDRVMRILSETSIKAT